MFTTPAAPAPKPTRIELPALARPPLDKVSVDRPVSPTSSDVEELSSEPAPSTVTSATPVP
jgi:hypothetical protein